MGPKVQVRFHHQAYAKEPSAASGKFEDHTLNRQDNNPTLNSYLVLDSKLRNSAVSGDASMDAAGYLNCHRVCVIIIPDKFIVLSPLILSNTLQF